MGDSRSSNSSLVFYYVLLLDVIAGSMFTSAMTAFPMRLKEGAVVEG